jgi:hypothetical protein
VVWSATVEEKKRAAVSCALAVSASVWWSSRETHTKGVGDQVIAMIRHLSDGWMLRWSSGIGREAKGGVCLGRDG